MGRDEPRRKDVGATQGRRATLLRVPATFAPVDEIAVGEITRRHPTRARIAMS